MAVTESIFYLGKPYEGKPHVRFDEGSRKTGFNICTASLSYSTTTNVLRYLIFYIY